MAYWSRFVLILVFSVFGVVWADPCSEHIEINNTALVTTFEPTDVANISCPTFAPMKWYRYTGTGDGLLTNVCPERLQCGSHAQIWINDTFPTVHEGERLTKVCIHMKTSCCYSANMINMKNCTDFMVYLFVPTPSCVNYCFYAAPFIDHTTVSGGVDHTTVGENVDHTTVSGNVDPTTVGENVDHMTVSGNVDPTTVGENVDTTTVSGNVDPTTVGENVDHTTIRKTDDHTTISKKVDLTTVSGNVNHVTVSRDVDPVTTVGGNDATSAEPRTWIVPVAAGASAIVVVVIVAVIVLHNVRNRLSKEAKMEVESYTTTQVHPSETVNKEKFTPYDHTML